jgi:CCR4-NOT transcription complex subunit 7/8
MSKSNSFKKTNNKFLSPNISLNNTNANDIFQKKNSAPKSTSLNTSNNIIINSNNNDQPGIVEVYEDNFIQEIIVISELLEEYNYVGMDTEFPGTVYNISNMSKDFYFRTLKMNVDSLKLIQLGITLTNEKGEFPKNYPYHTWQFNFQFDKNNDKILAASLNLLERGGIDFDKLKNKGIKHKLFAEYFMISGLVLNPDITWISFHGCYDFGYLLKLLLNSKLPKSEKEFMDLLNTYFINYYDIRTLVKGKDNLQGSLNRLAQYLEVWREGKIHQAGSDSMVTIDVYFKLLKTGLIDENKLVNNKNILFGVDSEEDNKETINYTRIGNMSYPNNNTNNVLYVPMGNNYVNMPYYYMMNNNIGNNHTTTQQNNSPSQMNGYNNF